MLAAWSHVRVMAFWMMFFSRVWSLRRSELWAKQMGIVRFQAWVPEEVATQRS
jgi:hypothetical protein